MAIESLMSNNTLNADLTIYNVSDMLVQSFEALKTVDSAKFGFYLTQENLGSEVDE